MVFGVSSYLAPIYRLSSTVKNFKAKVVNPKDNEDHFIGNKAKGLISKRALQENKAH